MSDDTIGNSLYDLLGDSKIVFNESGALFVRIPWFGGYRDYYTTRAGTKEDWLSRQQVNADGIATVHFSSDRNSASLPQTDPASSTGLDATVVPVQTSNNKAVSADTANAGSEQSANGVAGESGAVAMGSSGWTAELGSTVNGTKEKLTGVKLVDTFGINVNNNLAYQGIGSSRIEPQYLVDPLNDAFTDRKYFTEEELRDGVYYDEDTGMYTTYSGVPLLGEPEKFETREKVKEEVKERLEESSKADNTLFEFNIGGYGFRIVDDREEQKVRFAAKVQEWAHGMEFLGSGYSAGGLVPPVKTIATKMLTATERVTQGSSNAIAKFGENVENHLAKVEGFSQKRGISGGHNLEEFEASVNANNARVVKQVPHSSVEGVKEVEYQIPTLDAAGNPTGGYKATSFTKTVYDPKVISDAQMAEWGKQAAREAISSGRIGQNGRVWEGFAPNGLKFRGYIESDGTITNFFPILN